MSTRVAELFTINTASADTAAWPRIVKRQHCAYLGRKCLKIRKSRPTVSIGTCSVCYGRANTPVVICPHRLLERNQIFTDCLHLLTSHKPGNEFHVVSEVAVPGGSVDYFLLSARHGKVTDFVGIELQTVDTTGTVWPERQRFLASAGITAAERDAASTKSFGMNWKMTAKTTLVQLHHKVETFESLNKHLVIVLQDELLDYMKRMFSFDHISDAKPDDAMHFHSYALKRADSQMRLELSHRLSTDSRGIAASLGLQAESSVELAEIVSQLEAKISKSTLLNVFPNRSEEIADITSA